MISFITEDTRLRFHSLPLEYQREWMGIANHAVRAGKKVIFTFVGYQDGALEVSIRIDQ
jgi:hypothetical protein